MERKALNLESTTGRSLTSVRWARRRWFPMRLRMAAAHREMHDRSPIDLEVRASMLEYASRLDLVGSPMPAEGSPAPVWQYWGSGAGTAPPVVQRSMRSVADHVSDRPIIVLDDETIASHISLPGCVIERREAMGPAHFSDVLRAALLAEQGGTWIDATVYLTGPIPIQVRNAPFFASTRPEDPFLLSSWFLHTHRWNSLIVALRDALFAYWAEETVLSHYFQFHFTFEACVTLHQSLRDEWTSSPQLSFDPPHLLQRVLGKPFAAQEFAELCQASWIHKLTWKGKGGGPGTFLDHLLRI